MYRIFKIYSESSFPEDSGHTFTLCKELLLAKKTCLESSNSDPRVAKPIGSELLLSRRVFSAQSGPRQKM